MTDEAKPITTAYDIEANPDAEEPFDPIAWYEGTGEDLGLPEGYTELTPDEQALYEKIMRANGVDPNPPTITATVGLKTPTEREEGPPEG